MSAIDTVPGSFDMATTEELPLGFDTTPLLQAGQSNSNLTSEMIDRTTGATVSLTDSPTAGSGNIIIQAVRGSELTSGHIYDLYVSFQAASGTPPTVWTMHLTINCVGP